MSDRLETGPVHMPGDWPGVFIRGDQAAHFAQCLMALRPQMPAGEEIDDLISRGAVDGLIETLNSCLTTAGRTPQATPIQFAIEEAKKDG